MVVKLKLIGEKRFNSFTVNFIKNTRKAVGASNFQLAKRTAKAAQINFRTKHNRFGTGRSARTIVARKLSNLRSVVAANRIAGLFQEFGTKQHGSEGTNPLRFFWRSAPVHPGFREVPVIRPAAVAALEKLDKIAKLEFNKAFKPFFD